MKNCFGNKILEKYYFLGETPQSISLIHIDESKTRRDIGGDGWNTKHMDFDMSSGNGEGGGGGGGCGENGDNEHEGFAVACCCGMIVLGSGCIKSGCASSCLSGLTNCICGC